MIAEQPIPQIPRVSNMNLVLGALNRSVPGTSEDLSSNGNDGTPSGGVAFDPPGAVLDGIAAKIAFGDLGNLQEVSLLVKLDTTSEALFKTASGAYVHVVAGAVTFVGLTEIATYIDNVPTTAGMVAGQWHHLVVQFETEAADAFELGTDGTNFGAIEVRDLRAFTTARTTSEIAYEYHANIPDDDLAGLWLPRQSIITDLSRYRYDMSMIGSLPFPDLGAGPFTTSDYLKLTEADWRAPDTFGTIVAWMKIETLGVVKSIFASSDEATTQKYLLVRLSAANTLAVLHNDDTTLNIIRGDTVFAADTWYQVAVVSTGAVYILYVNGIAEGLTVAGGLNNGAWLNAAPVRDNVTIGVNQHTSVVNPFLGELSDVRYYRTPKSASFLRHAYLQTVNFYS